MQLARRAVSAIIIATCLLVVLGVFWLFFLLDPLVIGIDCDDTSIKKERKKSKMPEVYLTVGAAIVCITSLTVSEVALRFIGATERTKHRVLCCWVPSFVYYAGINFVAYMFGTHFTQGIVFLLKKITGRLRPDFWAVCRPIFFTPTGNCTEHEVIFNYQCANTDETEVSRARQTFPSGHASYAFFVATFLTIYFDRRLQTRREWSYVKKTIEFFLFCVAVWVAYERCQANAHHPLDAWVGSLIGIIGAFFTWPLLHTKQSLPIPSLSPTNHDVERDENNELFVRDIQGTNNSADMHQGKNIHYADRKSGQFDAVPLVARLRATNAYDDADGKRYSPGGGGATPAAQAVDVERGAGDAR